MVSPGRERNAASPTDVRKRHRLTTVAGYAVLVAGLILLLYLNRTSHLLFHTLAEAFSIIVGGGIFMVTWNTRRFSENDYLIFLGIGLLFVVIFDTLHMLAYQGMVVFPWGGPDLATQLWIAGQYLRSSAFIAAPLFLRGRYGTSVTLAVYSTVSGLLLASIFIFRNFPVCFVPGEGLTDFKIVSEYIIVAIFLLGILLLYRERRHFSSDVLRYIALSIGAAALAEAMFTSYVSIGDSPLVIGHVMKVFSYFLLYKAIIETGLHQPYGMLFGSLEESRAGLERQRRFLESAIEALTHPFYIVNADTYRIEIANSAARSLNDAAEGMTCHAFSHDSSEPCCGESHPCPLTEVKRTRRPAVVEHLHMDRTGKPRYVEVHGYPVFDEDGRIVQMIEYSLDITDRKLSQKMLERKSVELVRSNEELKQFAYIASHDLQEPLRMVSSYVQLLADRYRGRLDADADDFINFAVEGAGRMKDLINGLLSFSRVGTRGKDPVPVDAGHALEKALFNLKLMMEESRAELTHDPLPTVLVDELQLVQLFQNLVGNALKFRKEQEPPRIHVSAERAGMFWEFAIRDNGIGIDPRYVDRIFLIFQRLHGRDRYQGTGIGLALCKRIVERHGGAIRVESQPDVGTTFFFTLPDPVLADTDAPLSGE